MPKVSLPFEDLAKNHFTEAGVKKYRDWIENVKGARNTGSFDEKLNQYDKVKELISAVFLLHLN